ncbi:response regulator [Rhodococcus sp. LB1]|uniref:response regulator n=1 Tax=Rhodococcus sp. LB1 TaxID=1807499 RepID=UPI001E579CA1|nr:response regulator transcription factor [Rhodococcus sp. LB1]
MRVLIADDHAVVRRGLRAYLEVLEDVEVAAEASNGIEALERLKAMEAHDELPEVVLMDLRMPRMDGAAATAQITRQFPTVKVVVLTSFGEMARVRTVLMNGASGFLLKDAEPTEVGTAIRAAASGEVFLDPAVARQLTKAMVSPTSGLGSLTARERTVLALVADGQSNQEIADKLVISERTARTHVSNLLRKLELTSRTQAALLAIREGMVEPQ